MSQHKSRNSCAYPKNKLSSGLLQSIDDKISDFIYYLSVSLIFLSPPQHFSQRDRHQSRTLTKQTLKDLKICLFLYTRCQFDQHFKSSIWHKIVIQRFSVITVCVYIFCQKEIVKKAARKILMKLTKG